MTRGELYKELLERQKHLESQDFSLEGKFRQRELNLVIVRVQEMLLGEIGKKD